MGINNQSTIQIHWRISIVRSSSHIKLARYSKVFFGPTTIPVKLVVLLITRQLLEQSKQSPFTPYQLSDFLALGVLIEDRAVHPVVSQKLATYTSSFNDITYKHIRDMCTFEYSILLQSIYHMGMYTTNSPNKY